VAQLRIEIDETKRLQEVKQITGSDYYVSIKEKLKALREQEDEVSAPPGETMRLIYEQIKTPTSEEKDSANKSTGFTARTTYEKLETNNGQEDDNL
jgi:hypothetical protein